MNNEISQEQEMANEGTMPNPQDLADNELLCKMDELSSKLYNSRNKFMAYLPEIKKRKLWDNGSFTSVFHYARIKACLTDDTIERVFRTYDKVALFPEILKLFQEAIVGWSKIEIVASVLNKRNARHLAKRLLTNSTSTLKRLAKNIRESNKKSDGRIDSEKNGAVLTDPNIVASAKSSSKGFIGQDSLQVAAVQSFPQAAAVQGSLLDVAVENSTEQQTRVLLATSMADSLSETCAQAQPCEACGHIRGNSTRPGGKRRLVPLNVTPIVRDMYERLLHRWKRKDNKITMNDVAERVMLAALQLGIDLTFDSETGPVEMTVEGNLVAPTCRTEAVDGTDETAPTDKSEGNRGFATNGARKGQNKLEKERLTPTSRRFFWKRPFVLIVNYDVATGAFLTKTNDGWQRVSEQELAYSVALREEPIDLKQLRIEAKEYAADYIRKHILEGKEITDYIPEFIKYFIELRSQGFCEFPGCKKRGCKIHHIKRFCLDPDCDPDGLAFLCDECEKLFHDGVVENEFGPFKDFKIREDFVPRTEGEIKRAKIDAKVQAQRKAQKGAQSEELTKGSMTYPTPRRRGRRMRYVGNGDNTKKKPN